jgi:hypothetical protein
LNALQRDLRLSWSTAPDGERVTNAGALSRAFEKYLERRIDRAEEERRKNEHKMREEREALGRAMLAEDHVAQMRETRDAAIAYGERRRYKVTDARGRSRWLSEHDLRTKAGVTADRAMAGLSTDWNPEARRQMREGVFARELEKYKPVIKMIRKMRAADLNLAESKLRQAVEGSRPLIEKASAIKRQYVSAGLAVPAPILSREDVSRLQDRAIQRGDAGRLRELEAIRVSLAAEKGTPARTDREVGRLQSRLFVARSSLIAGRHSSQITRKTEVINTLSEILAREESQYRKDRRRMPEPVFTEQEMKELSAQAERRGNPEFYQELIKLERDSDARINHFSWAVNPDRVSRAKAREVMAEISARESQLELQRFNDQRGQLTVFVPLIRRREKNRQVATAVEDYGDRLRRRCEKASAIHEILKEAALEYEAEFVRQNPEKPVPLPQFTAWEIGKLELHATKECDPTRRARYEKLLNDSLTASRDDSETRAPGEIRRTIVLDDREAMNIFDSVVPESFTRDFEDRSPSQVDQAAMSYER